MQEGPQRPGSELPSRPTPCKHSPTEQEPRHAVALPALHTKFPLRDYACANPPPPPLLPPPKQILLERSKTQLHAAFRLFADSANYTVLVHCIHGER